MESVWLKTRASLIARLQGEVDSVSWEDFYDTYWRAIYGYAIHFGAPHGEAEDVVQEVLLKVFRRLATFEYDRTKGRFLSWLKTITRTSVCDRFRRRRARIEGRLQQEHDDVTTRIASLPDPDSPGVPDPWESEWRGSVLALALERIQQRVAARTYQAFIMYALEEKPAATVADELGITVDNVYVYRSRVVSLLREEVRCIQEEGGFS
ncbi:MAG: sigma-70 family RNA polymerase sigma factor [Verrucomicrobia bacterium]|jgi:RNA polymerase sigma-70 factor, ECF subfamily|nr:sigma-70 family RNA polymerase sigma factor [Verrucomicrobiota bacterium]